MYLIYSDECGSSFKIQENGINRDGQFFLYGGIPISAIKYVELEKFFSMLIGKYFGAKSRFDLEVHAGDIFYQKGNFELTSHIIAEKFFSEVAQLINKFDLKIIIGIAPKSKSRVWWSPPLNPQDQLRVFAQGLSCFFNGCERYLASKNQGGIIISDKLNDTEDFAAFLDQKNLTGPSGPNLSLTIRRTFYDIQKWRIDPNRKLEPIFSAKYEFEAHAAFLMDNIQYIDSRYSPMNQFTDCMLFIISRLMTKLWFRSTSLYRNIEYRVPIDESSLRMLLYQTDVVTWAHWQYDYSPLCLGDGEIGRLLNDVLTGKDQREDCQNLISGLFYDPV